MKIARDNYYRAYLNGHLIRDCFSGWGCYGNGEYWEETININNSWLKEGENLFAIAARDNTQGEREVVAVEVMEDNGSIPN